MPKRKCERCGENLMHRNYVKIVVDGKITMFCPKCASGVKLNGKMANSCNRMLSGRNILSR